MFTPSPKPGADAPPRHKGKAKLKRTFHVDEENTVDLTDDVEKKAKKNHDVFVTTFGRELFRGKSSPLVNFQMRVHREAPFHNGRPALHLSADNTVPASILIPPGDIMFLSGGDDTWVNMQAQYDREDSWLFVFFDQNVQGRAFAPKPMRKVPGTFVQRFLEKMNYWKVLKAETVTANDSLVANNLLELPPRSMDDLKRALANCENALESERYWLSESLNHLKILVEQPELVTPFDYAEAEIENRRLFHGLKRLENDKSDIQRLMKEMEIKQEMDKATKILLGKDGLRIITVERFVSTYFRPVYLEHRGDLHLALTLYLLQGLEDAYALGESFSEEDVDGLVLDPLPLP
jgi:hypothetical protein